MLSVVFHTSSSLVTCTVQSLCFVCAHFILQDRELSGIVEYCLVLYTLKNIWLVIVSWKLLYFSYFYNVNKVCFEINDRFNPVQRCRGLVHTGPYMSACRVVCLQGNMHKERAWVQTCNCLGACARKGTGSLSNFSNLTQLEWWTEWCPDESHRHHNSSDGVQLK